MVGARIVLLDLDRTLVDVQGFTDYAAALAEVTALVGTWPEVEVPEADWDRPTVACMSVLHALFGDHRWNAISEVIAAYEAAAIDASRPMPTLTDAVENLRQVPAAVVTLLPSDVASDVLAHHGVTVGPGECIDVVIGRRAHLRPKPEPDALVEACRLLGGSAQDAVMIGDSTWDLQAASAAGIPFIGVPFTPDGLPATCRTSPALNDAVRRALAGRP